MRESHIVPVEGTLQVPDTSVGRATEARPMTWAPQDLDIPTAIGFARALIMKTGHSVELSTDFESVFAEVVDTSKGRVNPEANPNISRVQRGWHSGLAGFCEARDGAGSARSPDQCTEELVEVRELR